MKVFCRAVLLVWLVCIFLPGCGGNSAPPTVPPANQCNGAILSGTLRDSLTFQPVAQGTAVLESGTELGITPLYNFFPAQSVTTNAQGDFSLCASAIPYPSVLVLEAMDANGNAYPPYVTFVKAGADLGTISMGGCVLKCAFADQQQTAAPATITGTITSDPIAVPGTVVPQYPMQALDGSKSPDGAPNLWSLALPLFPASPTLTFNTTSGACGGASNFCSSFTLPVPAQKPIYPESGGGAQLLASTVYMIYAELNTATTCSPQFGFTAFQPDGQSILMATPGAQLTAQTISFTNCH